MIIGGGIAGAVAAMALREAGLTPEIYEAYPSGADAYRMIEGTRAFFGHTTAPTGHTWWFARIPTTPHDAFTTYTHLRRTRVEHLVAISGAQATRSTHDQDRTWLYGHHIDWNQQIPVHG